MNIVLRTFDILVTGRDDVRSTDVLHSKRDVETCRHRNQPQPGTGSDDTREIWWRDKSTR